MKKILATAFAFLLTVGAFAIPAVMAVNPPAPVNATFTCSDGNSDVSLAVKIRNQGPDVIPTNTLISYTYKTSLTGPTKNGTYRPDSPIPVNGVRDIFVTPTTHWFPTVKQCSANVMNFKIIPRDLE